MAADEQVAYGEEGWRVVGENAAGRPDPNRWLTVVASEQLQPSDLPAIESAAVGLAEARDQWRANALRLSKELEKTLARVAELESQISREDSGDQLPTTPQADA